MELPEALRQLALLEPVDPGWNLRLEEFAKKQAAAGGQQADGGLLPVPDWASMEIPFLSRIRKEFQTSRRLTLLSPRGRKVAEELNLQRPLAFLAPGSVWATKMWTASGFKEVGRILTNEGYQVVFMGSGPERQLCEKIACGVPGAKVIAGTSLFESAELLALGSLFIGNDSGATHLASAAGVPTVSIFGPTILEFGYRPWQSRAKVVQVPAGSLQCRPCGKHGPTKCPVGTHECMTKIDVKTVIEAAHAVARM